MGADDKRSGRQWRHGPRIGRGKGTARDANSPGANATAVNHLPIRPRPNSVALRCAAWAPIAGRRHAAGILGRVERCGLLGGLAAHRASMRPAMQAFPPVSRCAAGALDRDTGQACNGNRCAEPQAPLCPRLRRSCRRYAAGEFRVAQ